MCGPHFIHRPDHLPRRFLDTLATYVGEAGKDCLIEVGLQTIHRRSLVLLNRNHNYADFLKACRRIRAYPQFEIGVHLLFGIPGETHQDMLTTVQEVMELEVDAVKFHHLQVLKETQLAKMYDEGRVSTMTMDDYLNLLVEILPFVPVNVVVHRLWATAHPQMLIAPRWHVLAAELSKMLHRRMDALQIEQGCISSL